MLICSQSRRAAGCALPHLAALYHLTVPAASLLCSAPANPTRSCLAHLLRRPVPSAPPPRPSNSTQALPHRLASPHSRIPAASLFCPVPSALPCLAPASPRPCPHISCTEFRPIQPAEKTFSGETFGLINRFSYLCPVDYRLIRNRQIIYIYTAKLQQTSTIQ